MTRGVAPRAAVLEPEDGVPAVESSPTAAPQRSAAPHGAWQRVEQALLAKSRKEKEIADRVVDVSDVVRDVYEFWGVSELGYFIIYFFLGILVLFMHWGTGLPVLKSNVQQSFLSYGDPPVGSGYQLSSVSCLYDGAIYLTGYASNALTLSDSRQLPLGITQIDEYSEVTYMRISAALQKNCQYQGLLCYSDNANGSTFNAQGYWQPIDNIPGVGIGQTLIADVVSSSIGSRNMSMAILQRLAPDMAYISKYAYFISLDMVIKNQLSPNDLVYMSLQIKRTMGMLDGPDQQVVTVSVTVSLSNGLYISKLDKARIVVELLFLCMNVWYLFREADIAYLAYQQFGAAGITRYFSCGWTWVNLIGFILTGGWMWWYMSLMVEDLHRDKALPTNAAAVNAALAFGISLQLWMYIGIISNVLLGLRMLKYMDLHASLRIYARVISYTWSTLRDFLVFFLYLLLLLGTAALAFFQISGGNPSFVTVQDALQSMALLTFGFLDWDTFRNSGLGLGTWQPTVIILFWLVVIALVLISQNIILSIVVLAYEQAKRSEPIVEGSILTLLFHRLSFDIRRLCSRMRMEPLHKFVEDTVSGFHHGLYRHGTGQESSQDLVASYLWARWAICLYPEVIMLRNYFFDFGHQQQQKQSRWDPAYRNFEPVNNAYMTRSFGHLLNRVQDEEEVLHAVVASSAQTAADKVAFAADVQAGPPKPAKSSLTFMLDSILPPGHSAEGDSGLNQSGSHSLWGTRSSKVAPASDPSSQESEPHKVLASSSDVGSAASHSESVPYIHHAAASCEEPKDFEELLMLMTKVIPGNTRFVTAKHLLQRHVSRFSVERLPVAADLIMRVYSFPRVAAKTAKGSHQPAATAAPTPAAQSAWLHAHKIPPWRSSGTDVTSTAAAGASSQPISTLPPQSGFDTSPRISAVTLQAAVVGLRARASLQAEVPDTGNEIVNASNNNPGQEHGSMQLLDVEDEDAADSKLHKGATKGKKKKHKRERSDRSSLQLNDE